MKKSEMNSLVAGVKIQHKRNNSILTVVAVEEDKIVCEEKTISISNCTRWFDVLEEQEIPEVVEPDNTVINDIEQAEDLTQEQDTQVVEPTITSDNTVDESSYTTEKNLDYKYLGEIILLGHKYSMLEQVYTKSIWFCTVDIHSIFIGNGAIGGITLNNGHQMFNCVRSDAELDNEVRILIVKKDYINRFQGKNLKVKIRHAFKELDSHNISYISKHCPYNIVPKSFWTDVVLPLKEGKDILPKLYWHQNTIENPTANIGVERIDQNNPNIVKIHILDVDPKVLPTELVSKLRAWGFKDSYITEGYLININIAQLGDNFIPIFNEVASIVDLPPMEEPGQEQQEDTTATTVNTDTVNEVHEDAEQTTKTHTTESNTATTGDKITKDDIIYIIEHSSCDAVVKKQYIGAYREDYKGAVVMVRTTKKGNTHIDMKQGIFNSLAESTRNRLEVNYNARVYDASRGYIRLFEVDDLRVLQDLILFALGIA